VLAEEEEEGSPETVPNTDTNMSEIDSEVNWRSGMSALLKTLSSCVTGRPDLGEDERGSLVEDSAPGTGPSVCMGSRLGGSSPDTLVLDGLRDNEDHLDGLWDNGVWGDGDNNDNGPKADSAQYTMTKILDALHCGWDPTDILPKTPFD
jgi:hypothetical protein